MKDVDSEGTKHHPTIAAAFAEDGSIGFYEKLPAGSGYMVSGRADEVRQAVSETAWLGPDGKTWFVPGARQAPISIMSRNALRAYVMKLNRRFYAIEATRKLKSPPDDPERK